MKSIYITILMFLAAGVLSAQPKALFTPGDQALFNDYLSYIEPYKEHPVERLLEKTATFFLGKPYEAHTLEVTEEERVVVNLRAFDCTTFVETVIALTNTTRQEKPSFSLFMNELQKIRYRSGVIEGYASRLHYTSDWVYENERKGLVKNISRAMGGVKEVKQLHFISSHRDAYKQLRSDDQVLNEIITMENEINRREGFYYLPKAAIAVKADRIPHMAMIAFTTSIKGLDVTHMGFAFRQDDRLTFIHASSAKNRVVIDEKSPGDYCAGQKSCSGVLVAEII
ncbi:MAG: DUF1460 domain-containing protein [Bacteroidales bacterium]|nr:DUF1460 domain-containing protein [Bacteroidales bacterium]